MRKFDRREFVHLSAAAAGGFACGGCFDGPIRPTETTASVSAVRGNDLYAITRDALDGIGGIQTVVGEGESVFIKPNMVSLPWGASSNVFANGENTKPEILIALAEECLRVGASEVIIGDGSQMPVLNWHRAITLDGSTNLAEETARLNSQYDGTARVASLEVDSPGWVELPTSTNLGVIAVSSLVANADRVISVAVAKTHSWAQLTLSLKNFIGITPLDRYAELVNGSHYDRGYGSFDHSSPAAIAQIYLDIVDGLKPDLAIIDFSIGVEANGPTLRGGLGRTVDMRNRLGSWLILASTDLVAADATAARIMSHNVNRMTQLTMAYDMGLGEIREDHIEMIGESIDNVQVAWAPADLENR